MSDFLQHIFEIKEYIDYVPQHHYVLVFLMSFAVFVALLRRHIFVNLITFVVSTVNGFGKTGNIKTREVTNMNYCGVVRVNSFPIGILIYFAMNFVFYFMVVVNLYCAAVGIGQIIYYVAPIDGVATHWLMQCIMSGRNFLFLVCCGLLKAYMDTLEIVEPLKNQIATNRRMVKKVVTDSKSYYPGTVVEMPQHLLKIGDVVLLKTGDGIPADLILLSVANNAASATDDVEVILNEKDLDGELNQKVKEFAPDYIVHKFKKLLDARDVEVAKFISTLVSDVQLFAGTNITGGADDGVYGIVHSVGSDCLIRSKPTVESRQSKPTVESRRLTPLESVVDLICLYNLFPLMLMSGMSSLILYAAQDVEGDEGVLGSRLSYFIQMVLYINTIIPLGLRFYYGSSTYSVARRISSGHDVKITSKGVVAIQSNPNIIVTDKTGTLTMNELNLLRISCKDEEYLMKHKCSAIMACNATRVDKSSGRRLEVDVADLKLLESLGPNVELKENVLKTANGVGFIRWSGANFAGVMTDQHMLRVYASKKFDYITRVKCAIVCLKHDMESNEEEHWVYAQGQPEAMSDYCVAECRDDVEDLIAIEKESASLMDVNKKYIGFGSRKLNVGEVVKFRAFVEENQLAEDPVKLTSQYLRAHILPGLTNVGVYVFEDKLRPMMKDSIQYFLQRNIDVCICTGDRLDTTIEVAEALQETKERICIDGDVESFNSSITRALSELAMKPRLTNLYINGQILTEVLENKRSVDLLGKLLDVHTRLGGLKSIYRAAPSVKQDFVKFLKSGAGSDDVGRYRVLAIGDGKNDEPMIKSADVGVACEGEAPELKAICDVAINDWSQLPRLVEDCRDATRLSENVCLLILMQHIIKAYGNYFGFVLTSFTLISEKENFATMLFFKMCTFQLCSFYCKTDNFSDASRAPTASREWYKFLSIIVKGIFITSLNSLIVYVAEPDYNKWGNILQSIHMLQTVLEMNRFKKSNWDRFGKILLGSYGLVWSMWFLYCCGDFKCSFTISVLEMIVCYLVWGL